MKTKAFINYCREEFPVAMVLLLPTWKQRAKETIKPHK